MPRIGILDGDLEHLMAEARAAGLTWRAEGDQLIVAGPKHATPLALALGARKEVVLAILTEPLDLDAVLTEADPDWRAWEREEARRLDFLQWAASIPSIDEADAKETQCPRCGAWMWAFRADKGDGMICGRCYPRLVRR